MKKIKNFLIKRLGGHTNEEVLRLQKADLLWGGLSELLSLKSMADQLFGTPADEWSAFMYDQIKKRIDYKTHKLETRCKD